MSANLSYEILVESLADSGSSLLDLASNALGCPVPSCPGWDVAALVNHLGHIYDWARRNVTAPPGERVRLGCPDQGGVVRCREELGALVTALTATTADSRCAGPLQPRTAAWWARRQFLETVVHRWDIENALGTPGEIDEAVAAVGVAEFLEVFARGAEMPIRVHATNAELLLLLWGRLDVGDLEVEGDLADYRRWRGGIAT